MAWIEAAIIIVIVVGVHWARWRHRRGMSAEERRREDEEIRRDPHLW